MPEDGEDRAQIPPVRTLHQARYSRSLERGLAILGCFTPEQPLLGIAELAGRLDMSRPTTHRYVTTLVTLGLLEQDPSRKYRLRLDVVALGMVALNETGLPAHARPYLGRLAELTSQTVDLSVLDGAESLLVDRARPARPKHGDTEQQPRVGSRNPAHCTSAGKVLLAHLPPAQRSRLISTMELTQLGPKTITDKRALGEELKRVRKRGLAVADEELIAGACAIAAPVRAELADVVAAVSIVARTSAIAADELVEQFGGVLITTTEQISARLGWRGV